MFRTMLDAVGNILRMHYKSMKCDVLFSQSSESIYLGEWMCSSCICKNFIFAYSSVKLIKIEGVFPKL